MPWVLLHLRLLYAHLPRLGAFGQAQNTLHLLAAPCLTLQKSVDQSGTNASGALPSGLPRGRALRPAGAARGAEQLLHPAQRESREALWLIGLMGLGRRVPGCPRPLHEQCHQCMGRWGQGHDGNPTLRLTRPMHCNLARWRARQNKGGRAAGLHQLKAALPHLGTCLPPRPPAPSPWRIFCSHSAESGRPARPLRLPNLLPRRLPHYLLQQNHGLRAGKGVLRAGLRRGAARSRRSASAPCAPCTRASLMHAWWCTVELLLPLRFNNGTTAVVVPLAVQPTVKPSGTTTSVIAQSQVEFACYGTWKKTTIGVLRVELTVCWHVQGMSLLVFSHGVRRTCLACTLSLAAFLPSFVQACARLAATTCSAHEQSASSGDALSTV